MQLGNHLGNVLVTVSDRKRGVADPLMSSLISHFEPIMLSGTDYYPFGMPMRVGGDNKYKYGFNGKENDNEVKGGDGLQLDYGFRVYDPRLAKFLSVDPLTRSYPWYTPYQFAGNKPIAAVDLDGLEEKIVTLQQFSLPRMDVILTVNKAPDPYRISLGPNPRIDKEVVAAAIILQAQLDNPRLTIPTNGQFVFLEYPDNPEKNSAAYNVEMYGQTHHFTVSPQVLKSYYDDLPKSRVNLGLVAEAFNLFGTAALIKSEMKAVSSEMRAAATELNTGVLKVPQGLSSEGFNTMSKKIIDNVGHLSDDIVIQGSRAAGTARIDSDFDIAIKLDPDKFAKFLGEKFQNVNVGSAKEKTFIHAFQTGKIQAGEAGLSGLRKELEKMVGKPVDISVIKKGGQFDNGAQIPIPRTNNSQ